MLRISRAVLLALTVVLMAFATARAGAPESTLRMISVKVVTSLPAGAVIDPVRCDQDGNIYSRRYQYPKPLGAAVAKISPEGQLEGTFGVKQISDGALKGSQIGDFAIAGDGDVYLLVNTRPSDDYPTGRHAIVHLNSHGEFEGAAELPGRLQAFRFAVFPDGQFLVTGARSEGAGAESQEFLPGTYLVDGYGHIVGTVRLPHDAKIRQLTGSPSGTPDFGPVALGSIEVGDDGNMYLWRRMASPVVYVISSAAKVVRVLNLVPPGPGLTPWVMKVAQGTIVFEFSKHGSGKESPDEDIFATYDATTGQPIEAYRPPPSGHGPFACYTDGQFTFLGNRKGFGAILQAAPAR